MEQNVQSLWDKVRPTLGSTDLSIHGAAMDLVGEIYARYHESQRHYHNENHLSEVVEFLVDNGHDIHDMRTTLWAGLGHDVIYSPTAQEKGLNEKQSAQFMRRKLKEIEKPERIEKVGSFILATIDHKWDGKDTDLAYLLDADLIRLGAAPDKFDEFSDGIRREYGHVQESAYRVGRRAVLQSFLNMPRIFVTDTAHEQYEAQARENLQRGIDELA